MTADIPRQWAAMDSRKTENTLNGCVCMNFGHNSLLHTCDKHEKYENNRRQCIKNDAANLEAFDAQHRIVFPTVLQQNIHGYEKVNGIVLNLLKVNKFNVIRI